LYLGETGDPAMDCVFVEFNGVLAETGRERELTNACLRAARVCSLLFGRIQPFGWLSRRRLVLSGIGTEANVSAGEIGAVQRNRSLPAPYVELRAGENCFLERRSANTRQQIRRSNRSYGEVTIERADTSARAQAFLDGLESLHQASWVAREQAGAFARPFFGQFHRALIERGLMRDEIDLLHIKAGQQTIGFLYNFRYRGRSLAYQSGFDYAAVDRHRKPGLTCHFEAIQFAVRSGAARYDFLAGVDRYKRSLSDRAETLHWIEVTDPWSPRFMARRAWNALAAVVPRSEYSSQATKFRLPTRVER